MRTVVGFLAVTFLLSAYVPAFAQLCDQKFLSLSSSSSLPSPSSPVVKPSKQETGAWCWAASTQMVMEFHRKRSKQLAAAFDGEPVSQCKIVNDIYHGGRNECCGNKMYGDSCSRGGWPESVLGRYNFYFLTLLPPDAPLTWDEVKAQICRYGPFVFGIEWDDGGRHSFVARGYKVDSRGQQWVEIYDHFEDDFFWQVYEEFAGDPAKGYEHSRDYVYIQPPP